MQTDLPIADVLDELKRELADGDVVLQAPPGSGKTTIVPLALMDEVWLGYKKIIMLEPRRIAARSAAYRMAQLIGESPGQTVGYRMRLETRVSDRTKIEVITEGILTRMLQTDPALSDIGLVIFDEFHERSLDADLALSLTLKGRSLFREGNDPLRILVMSATLEHQRISSLLGDVPVINADGRLHPVDINFVGASAPRDRIVDRIVPVIRQAAARHPESSLLVFLPGQGEIANCRSALSDLNLPGVDVMPLFGNLSIDEQQAAINPSVAGRRKIVLATNIAETSLTIEGVDVVVDSGLVREPVYDPPTAMTRLHTLKISQASSTQRAGRAGRLRPGTCYRLWSRDQQQALATQSEPEILSADLTALALQLFNWGIHDPAELDWLDAPPRGAWQQAVQLLAAFDAIEETPPRLTSLGEQMAQLPVHPRLAKLMIIGKSLNEIDIASLLAAVLSDRDPIPDDPDMTHRLDILTHKTACPGALRGWANRTVQQADQYQSMLREIKVDRVAIRLDADHVPGFLLTCAYPDRIARKRHAEGFQLANGRTANLPEHHYFTKARWLAVAEVSGVARRKGDQIRSAATLDESLFETVLKDRVTTTEVVEWDKRQKRFIAERRTAIGALVLKRDALPNVPIEAKREALIAHVRSEGLKLLPWTPALRQFRARVALIRVHMPDLAMPDLSDDALMATLEEWLGPYLDSITQLNGFGKLDLSTILHNCLPYSLQQTVKQLAPERIEVPSGSNLVIDYTESPPVLAVKLQEMFGCETTPTVLQGRVRLLVHLLSPAGRPLQITQDLANFWRTSYQAVKKEMKGRYPKHPWPDDPFSIPPTAGVKRK